MHYPAVYYPAVYYPAGIPPSLYLPGYTSSLHRHHAVPVTAHGESGQWETRHRALVRKRAWAETLLRRASSPLLKKERQSARRSLNTSEELLWMIG